MYSGETNADFALVLENDSESVEQRLYETSKERLVILQAILAVQGLFFSIFFLTKYYPYPLFANVFLNILAALFLILECGISQIKLQKFVKSLFYFNVVKSCVLSIWVIGECLDPSTPTWAAWLCFVMMICEFIIAVMTLRIVGLTNRFIGLIIRRPTTKNPEDDVYYY